MIKRFTLLMVLIGMIISCTNETIENDLQSMELEKGASSRAIKTGLVYYHNMPYYIDGPYTNTKTVTHPLLTSTEYPGNCTLTCSITYDYYRTYAGVSVSGIYIGIAGGEIRNVTTRFTNNTNGTFYLLWQNQGTRAFYTSSDIDPIMQPQRNIYMQFLGQIVGQTQFFGLPEDTPKPINSSAVISVMP